MSRSVNMVVLIGNVGADPEVETSAKGFKYAKLRLATTRSWTDSNSHERRNETEWHSIVIYVNGLIGVLEKYVKKGAKLYVRGRIKTDTWDTEDGRRSSKTSIVLDQFNSELVLLDKSNKTSQDGGDLLSKNSDIDVLPIVDDIEGDIF